MQGNNLDVEKMMKGEEKLEEHHLRRRVKNSQMSKMKGKNKVKSYNEFFQHLCRIILQTFNRQFQTSRHWRGGESKTDSNVLTHQIYQKGRDADLNECSKWTGGENKNQ